jgi:hypothetical protein
MRRFLALYLIVCALLLASAQAFAQMMMGVGTPPKASPSGPTFVQGKLGPDLGNVAATSTAVMLSSTVHSGDAVLVTLTWFAGSSSAGVVDDKSNAYTPVDTLNVGAGCNLETFYSLNVTNGPSVITATITFPISGTATFWRIVADEFSGLASFDAHSGQIQSGISGSDAMSSGSATTAFNGELIYGGGADGCAATTHIANGTGFTPTESATDSDNQPLYGEYLIQPSAGSIAATFSPTASTDTATGMMTFVP